MAWYRCFFPDIDGQEAVNLLKDSTEGSFLIRPSSSNQSDSGNQVYTLTAKSASQVVHTRIQFNGDGYEFTSNAGEAFASLTDLVEYYMENKDLLKTNEGEKLNLKFPYRYNDHMNDPTQERWYHGNITGVSAEALLSGTEHQDGAFLVRDSRTRPGNFAFSVKSLNKIIHLRIYKNPKGKFQLDPSDSPTGGKEFITLDALVEHYKKFGLVDKRKNLIKFTVPVASSRVAASAFPNRVRALDNQIDGMGRRTGYAEEFRELQESEALKKNTIVGFSVGKKRENEERNRYRNIVPYDNFRVQLEDGGYINASYINHYDTHFNQVENKKYISTQGPLPNTIEHFWQMVANEESTIIMMIAREQERGRKKCEVYWPTNEGEERRWGCAKVTLSREIQKGDIYTQRYLTVEIDGRAPHNVVQYQFLKWPDFDVPKDREIGEVLEFLFYINETYKKVENKKKGAIVVHCSAGIGRSGAIIVIDMICDQIRKYGINFDIEVQKTVMHCREHRPGMVQTEAQYAFIYKAIQQQLTTCNERAMLLNPLPPEGV